MSTSPFPFGRSAVDVGSGATSPKLARDVWTRIRKVEMVKARISSWFAVDFMIFDPNRLMIQVYDIHDNVWGGVGEMVHQVHLTLEDLTPSEAAEFQRMLTIAYTNAAEAELDRRAAEARKQEILELRKQLFGV
jgi:hypothetical protein